MTVDLSGDATSMLGLTAIFIILWTFLSRLTMIFCQNSRRIADFEGFIQLRVSSLTCYGI